MYVLIQVVSASISQYDVENGRSACTCICLEASLSILGRFGLNIEPDDVVVSVSVLSGSSMSPRCYAYTIAESTRVVDEGCVPRRRLLCFVAQLRVLLLLLQSSTDHFIVRCDLVQNMVNVGVAMYEAVAASGSLTVEHTSVAEILPTVAR